jgi:hypothetical protein
MDGQISNKTMDTSPSQSYRDIYNPTPSFVSFIRSPHDVVPVLQTPQLYEAPPFFLHSSGVPNVLPNTMQVSVPKIPPNMAAVSVLNPPSQLLGPAPGLIPDFQQQCDTFGIPPRLDRTVGTESSRYHTRYPPSSIQAITSYGATPSSLATALSGVPTGRSQAHSMASPRKLTTSIPPAGSSVAESLASADPASMPFSPADHSSGFHVRHEAMPDVRPEQPSMLSTLLARFVVFLLVAQTRQY